MIDITISISAIKNFMGNASRTACNEYLYDALQDAVESMERRIQKMPAEVNRWRTVSYYKCQTCGGLLPIGKNFCCGCGQALDWNGITDNSELKDRLRDGTVIQRTELEGSSYEKCMDRLAEYEDLGVTPEQLRQIDDMYAERCREIADLKRMLKDALETAM